MKIISINMKISTSHELNQISSSGSNQYKIIREKIELESIPISLKLNDDKSEAEIERELDKYVQILTLAI